MPVSTLPEMNPLVDQYLIDGCMRCSYGATPQCKVHRWKEELVLLRQLVLESGLTEDRKWGVPCYTLNKKNVLMIFAFKDSCCISFFKGALLSDSKKILVKPGENSQAGRYLQFSSTQEVLKQKKNISAYIREAIQLEQTGKKIEFKKETEPAPPELMERLNQDAAFKKAFYALTTGRQRGYILYFSQPKQAETRHRRIEACVSKIMAGEGLHDKYKS